MKLMDFGIFGVQILANFESGQEQYFLQEIDQKKGDKHERFRGGLEFGVSQSSKGVQ